MLTIILTYFGGMAGNLLVSGKTPLIRVHEGHVVQCHVVSVAANVTETTPEHEHGPAGSRHLSRRLCGRQRSLRLGRTAPITFGHASDTQGQLQHLAGPRSVHNNKTGRNLSLRRHVCSHCSEAPKVSQLLIYIY